ncbi:MAG: radical SAM protein [Verrucomicrobiaceae bacterium]|nr:radical SAM protein [Verrucomicrobiaceae bacterium]
MKPPFPNAAAKGPAFDFNDRPFVIIWEITRACALACRHCRAEAEARAHSLQLNTEEGFRLIDQVKRANPALFIMTGGDPVMRRDLPQLARYATDQGLHVSLSPSATPRLVNSDFHELKREGIQRISLSIDGPTREEHDAFRGVPGTWDWTMRAIEKAREADLPFQINTTITRGNIGRFDAFRELLVKLKPALWSVFLVVPTGRATAADMPDPDELEDFLVGLYHYSLEAQFDVKTTEGPFYRRIQLQRGTTNQNRYGRQVPLGINDGKGFVFISHTGEINPSGFLPFHAGNVRRDELIDVYRTHPTFRHLRDAAALRGKCGQCEFNTICGGSRARAYAMTGNPLGEDPLCVYQPVRMTRAGVSENAGFALA